FWSSNGQGDIYNNNTRNVGIGIGPAVPRGMLEVGGDLWPFEICLRHASGTWECADSWQKFRYIITSSPAP
ncbi:MAG: hypothetical protein Q7S19_00620, partial [bacterium]|nr:hypothetical protein [bacterium]